MQANKEAENTEEKIKIKIILSPQPGDNADNVFEVIHLLKMHMIYAYQIKSSPVPFSVPQFCGEF